MKINSTLKLISKLQHQVIYNYFNSPIIKDTFYGITKKFNLSPLILKLLTMKHNYFQLNKMNKDFILTILNFFQNLSIFLKRIMPKMKPLKVLKTYRILKISH